MWETHTHWYCNRQTSYPCLAWESGTKPAGVIPVGFPTGTIPTTHGFSLLMDSPTLVWGPALSDLLNLIDSRRCYAGGRLPHAPRPQEHADASSTRSPTPLPPWEHAELGKMSAGAVSLGLGTADSFFSAPHIILNNSGTM